MNASCTEELVSTWSEDEIALDGVAIRSAAAPAKPLATVFIPGFTSNFYRPHVLLIARTLAAAGYTVIAGNTRGHDAGAVLYRKDGSSFMGGAWWEQFDESPRDVGAWVSFAVGLGFPQVVLLGHSLGAQKVVYYQAQRRDPRVRGVIAASGPVRRGRGIKPATLALAERLVAEGRPEALLPIEPWLDDSPPPKPGPVSAQTFLSYARFNLDVFGVDTPQPAVARIRCPLFVCYGTEEPEMATAPDLEMIRRNAQASSAVHTQMFEGANHTYAGHESAVARAFARWIDGLR